MDKLTLVHVVQKEQEGSYYTLEFDVPENIEALTVSYAYSKLQEGSLSKDNLINVVDFGLEDADGRFIGWSGSARRSVSVGEFSSTHGYLTTAIKPGKWRIIIGAYKIAKQGVPVRYEVVFTEKHPRWLFGDLHMHSDASDGQHSHWQLVRLAHQKHLDFIAVTDHNNYSENLNLPKPSALTLIPGVEWTHYRGHMNFYGAAIPFRNSFIANNIDDMHRLIDDAKAAGALISVNHPKDGLCPYLWEDDICFDLIEVWNGPMRKANVRAIAWWTGLLKTGRKIPIIGGSDFHRDARIVRMANPVTAVYAPSPKAEAILAAIKQGHSYIIHALSGVRITISNPAVQFGDTLDVAEKGTQLHFQITNAAPGMGVKIVTADGIAATFRKRTDRTINAQIVVKNPGFVYVLVTRKVFHFELICAISNPVYFEKHQPAPAASK